MNDCMKARSRMRASGLIAVLALSVGFGWAEGQNTAQTLAVSVVPGENWQSTMWIAFIPVKKSPQLAVWVETLDGSFVSTLSVTARSGTNEWQASPKEGRPEALPVWRAASKGAIDASSSATPKAGLELERAGDVLVPGTEYRVLLEVNASFDYNGAWPKGSKKGEPGYSGVNGQPSLVYEARFVAGTPSAVELLPVGKGSIDGSDGAVVPGLEGLTTALTLISKPTLVVK